MSHGESIMERAQRAADESGETIVVVDDPHAERAEERFQYCTAAAKIILFPRGAIVSVVHPSPTAKRSQSANGKRSAEVQTLINAAKSVVALSAWRITPKGEQVFQSSAMAVKTLHNAIEAIENPKQEVLQLAPEPIEAGKV